MVRSRFRSENTDMKTDTKLGRMVLIGVGVVALAAVVVGGVLGSRRTIETHDLSTPEGVVQIYLRAALEGDGDAAVQWFTEELRADCSSGWYDEPRQATRVVLDDVSIVGDTASVDLTIQVNQDPFDEYSYTERIHLVRQADEWRIEQVPWPYYGCR